MKSPVTRFGAALILAASAVLVTACSAPEAPEAAPTETTTPTPSAPAPEPEDTATEAPISADATCETIIGPAVVADFESIGWSAQAERFYLGAAEIPDGIQCKWADLEGPAGDHLTLFGWAPLAAAQATESQDALEAEGWIREEGPEGVYITEPEETRISVDDEGYGMTYLFGDGWVKLAGTKQDLLLIEWP